ncbi:MAG: hypothetical protein SNJ77_06310 [Cytophagales bacterium]
MEHFVKINSNGGIITALQLEKITETARASGLSNIGIGSRQDLWLKCKSGDQVQKISYLLSELSIKHELNSDKFPSRSTSFPAEGIFTFDGWITEGNYRSILDLFDFQPKLKVNLVDHGQCLNPYFTGHLNFVTSKIPNYWYLYWRMPKEMDLYLWPKLVYSTAIPTLTKKLDDIIKYERIREKKRVVELVENNLTYLSQEVQDPLILPRYQFPYYEGFNRIENDYWLGIYRRNDVYDVSFLNEMAKLCQNTQVPLLCLTTWKSILIKKIGIKDRILWEKLLGKHGINVRHAALELNWMVEDHLEDAERLKNEIVTALYKEDVRTYGLVFGIKYTESYKSPASVLIVKNNDNLFDLYHTEDFNPNNQNLIEFKKNLKENELFEAIKELCKYFYKQLNSSEEFSIKDKTGIEKIEHKKVSKKMYQCLNCLHIYDPELSIDKEKINDYICPVCESGKEFFKEVIIEEV